MGEVFKSVLLLSLAGSVVSIVIILIRPFTRRVFSPVWQYYIWLVALAAYVLPVTFSISLKDNRSFEMPAITYESGDNIQRAEAGNNNYKEIQEETKKVSSNNIHNYINVLAVGWIAVGIMIFICKTVKYGIFMTELKRNSCECKNICNEEGRLKIRRTPLADAPFVTGVFKPVIYIPDVEMEETKMEYVIRHELIHYRRGDIFYKWFAMLVKCIHWFDPVIYFVIKNIDEDCEISCDYMVTRKMNESERKDYMNTILDLLYISVKNKNGVVNQMAGNKKIIERRFHMISRGRKYKVYVTVVSIAAAIVIISGSVFAGGSINERAGNNAEQVSQYDDYSDEYGYAANYDIIYSNLFDAENMKYSRDYTDDELSRREKLSYEYQWNNMKPSKSMSERTADDGMYFDTDTNTVVFPERELTDDEILALVEFQSDINLLYAENIPEPAKGMISEQEAVETAKNEILYFYGADSSDYNISCGYDEASEDGYDSDKNMFFVMFEPVDMPYIEEQGTDYYVYFVDIEAETGDVITVDSYYSGMKEETEEIESLSSSERAEFEKKSREVMNIPGLGEVKEQYISQQTRGRSVCTVFDLEGKEIKVELTYPNMDKIGWSVEE